LIHNPPMAGMNAELQKRSQSNREQYLDLMDSSHPDLSFNSSLPAYRDEASEDFASDNIKLRGSYGYDHHNSFADDHDDFDRRLLHEAMQGSHPRTLDHAHEHSWLGLQEPIPLGLNLAEHARNFDRRTHSSGAAELPADYIGDTSQQMREDTDDDHTREHVNWPNDDWIHASGQGQGQIEEQEQFMGFARPHILY